jgi:hypothetical protein
MEPIPHPGLLPVAESAPARHAGAAAQLRRQQLPGDAGFEDEDDPGQGGAVRNPGATTLGLGRFRWQQRGDEGP